MPLAANFAACPHRRRFGLGKGLGFSAWTIASSFDGPGAAARALRRQQPPFRGHTRLSYELLFRSLNAAVPAPPGLSPRAAFYPGGFRGGGYGVASAEIGAIRRRVDHVPDLWRKSLVVADGHRAVEVNYRLARRGRMARLRASIKLSHSGELERWPAAMPIPRDLFERGPRSGRVGGDAACGRNGWRFYGRRIDESALALGLGSFRQTAEHGSVGVRLAAASAGHMGDSCRLPAGVPPATSTAHRELLHPDQSRRRTRLLPLLRHLAESLIYIKGPRETGAAWNDALENCGRGFQRTELIRCEHLWLWGLPHVLGGGVSKPRDGFAKGSGRVSRKGRQIRPILLIRQIV